MATAALPQYKDFNFESVTSNQVRIPEGCTFISSSKEYTNNGRIEGEYSYKDPVNSIITVTYSVNVDGTDYTESRRVQGKKKQCINMVEIKQLIFSHVQVQEASQVQEESIVVPVPPQEGYLSRL